MLMLIRVNMGIIFFKVKQLRKNNSILNLKIDRFLIIILNFQKVIVFSN